MITTLQGMRACPHSSLKIKNNNQPSFKSNVVTKAQNQSMTNEQKTWLGIGIAALATLVSGIVILACSKKTKTSETSKTIDKTQLNPQEQVKDLEKNMQKHFINVSLKQYNPRWDMVKVVPNVAAPFESQNEFQLYEMKILVPQLLGRRQQLYTDKLLSSTNLYELHNCHDGGQEARLVKGIKYKNHYNDKPNGEKGLPTLEKEADDYADKNAKIKETFVEYLKLRSEYFDKGNDFDVVRSEVLKDPSDDVVDVETLRLSMLANNTRQFLYSDESVEEPHNMTSFIQPLIIANYSAKMLEEFKPKKAQKDMTENEKKYFEYMNKLGAFWHERLKKEASEKLSKFVKIITGEVEAPKCYTKGQEEVYDKRYIFVTNSQQHSKLSDILSSGAKSKWDEVMEDDDDEEKIGLKTRVIKLEAAFINLKNAVEKHDSSLESKAKKSIGILTGKVLP